MTQTYWHFAQLIERAEQEAVAQQQQMLKQRVDQAIHYIDHRRKSLENEARIGLKRRVDSAHRLILQLIEEQPTRPREELEYRILELLRALSFRENSYLFAIAADGELLLSPNHRSSGITGKQESQAALKQWFERLRQQQEMFAQYRWSKSQESEREYSKLSYFRYLAPLDWAIGEGIYSDELEQSVQLQLLSWLDGLTFPNEGYFFIGNWDGIILSRRPEGAMGKDMRPLRDPNGVAIVEELIRLAQGGGGFLSYVMPDFNGTRSAPKISYVTGVPEWRWFIGVGNYSDDINEAVAVKRQQLNRTLFATLATILVILLLATVAIFVISHRLTHRISGDLQVLNRFFREAAAGEAAVDRDVLRLQEIRESADLANAMILERVQIEEDKALLEEQLRQSQKMEAVGQLAGGIAHDFNNLLQVINGYAELALSGEPEQREEIEKILEAGEKATQIVNQLLAFSRRQLINPQILDLNALLQEHTDLLKRLIGDRIQLQFLPCAEPTAMRGDRIMVEQVLMNICVNARDAMPEGGQLTLATQRVMIDNAVSEAHLGVEAGEFIAVSVTDTGCGMEAKTLEHIFEPFFSTKVEKQRTGLGLAMAYGIVKQHNGFIEVRSQPRRGTTFTVYWPAAHGLPQSVAKPSSQNSFRGSETILLAEDESMVRQLTQAVLERAGYRVITAAHGREALARFEQQGEEIDLLILDLVMPHLGGFDVYKALDRRHIDRPTLFISGYSEEQLADELARRPALKLIKKPFSHQQLLQSVRALLDSADICS